MKTKKVTQYICEHCNKKGLSASHISIHEKHCTMNPARECRMCVMVNDYPQLDLEEALAFLPDPEEAKITDEYGISYNINFEPAVNGAVKKLRDKTSCPACIMAALRQKGIPVPCAKPEYDYKKEVEELFYQHNQDQLEKMYGY